MPQVCTIVKEAALKEAMFDNKISGEGVRMPAVEMVIVQLLQVGRTMNAPKLILALIAVMGSVIDVVAASTRPGCSV